MQCQNASCGLRFPLDLTQFGGKFCPRCGADLKQDSPRVASQSFATATGKAKRWVGVLDNLRSAHNVGSIFRSADGLGLNHLHLGGITPTPDIHPAVAKTALGAEKNIPWTYSPNAVAQVEALKRSGAMIIVLEAVPQSISLYDLKTESLFEKQEIVLVVGNEPAGVDPEVIALADTCVFIPMLGEKKSLNVAIAFSIAAYHLAFGM